MYRIAPAHYPVSFHCQAQKEDQCWHAKKKKNAPAIANTKEHPAGGNLSRGPSEPAWQLAALPKKNHKNHQELKGRRPSTKGEPLSTISGWIPHRQYYFSEKNKLVATVSLLTISSTFNSLFRVLCIFPSRYLFAIGLSLVFSFRWNLPPILGCILKQPDS